MWHPTLLPIDGPKRVQWPEEPRGRTPWVPPVPVTPPPCPATTTLGVVTLARGPTNPPRTTGTTPAARAWEKTRRQPSVETSARAKASQTHLNPCELGTSLPTPKSGRRGQREELVWVATSRAMHAGEHREGRG